MICFVRFIGLLFLYLHCWRVFCVLFGAVVSVLISVEYILCPLLSSGFHAGFGGVCRGIYFVPFLGLLFLCWSCWQIFLPNFVGLSFLCGFLFGSSMIYGVVVPADVLVTLRCK